MLEIQAEIDREMVQKMIDIHRKQSWKILMIPLSDSWIDCEFSGELCPKCNYTMLYKKSYFIVGDEYGCPRCGHMEGGTY